MAFYNPQWTKELRSKLRYERQPSERMLWERIRRRQLGVRFRSQFGIGPYIVDFCCPRLKLIIEVDGGYHDDPKVHEYDLVRQQYLEARRFTVVRYTAHEVVSNVDGVVEDLMRVCEKRTAQKAPPYEGGDGRRAEGV